MTWLPAGRFRLGYATRFKVAYRHSKKIHQEAFACYCGKGFLFLAAGRPGSRLTEGRKSHPGDKSFHLPCILAPWRGVQNQLFLEWEYLRPSPGTICAFNQGGRKVEWMTGKCRFFFMPPGVMRSGIPLVWAVKTG